MKHVKHTWTYIIFFISLETKSSLSNSKFKYYNVGMSAHDHYQPIITNLSLMVVMWADVSVDKCQSAVCYHIHDMSTITHLSCYHCHKDSPGKLGNAWKMLRQHSLKMQFVIFIPFLSCVLCDNKLKCCVAGIPVSSWEKTSSVCQSLSWWNLKSSFKFGGSYLTFLPGFVV